MSDKKLWDQYVALEKERDELLDALQVMVRDYGAAHAACGDLEMAPALLQAQRAIARATGEQQP